MHYDLIIKNGTIVNSENSYNGDVAIKNGKIVKTGILESSDTADEVYDASDKHVLPGIIDAHVHFRDPGLTEKEDFESGSLAAVMGGITMIADMPNVIPVTSTTERFNEKVEIARQKSYTDFAFFALLNDENLNEMNGLKEAGALGFKVFLGTSTGDVAAPSFPVLKEQMEAAASMGLRIGFHAELNDINNNFTTIAKIETDSPDGFWLDYSRPVMSEIKAAEIVLNYALNTKAKVHIHHITCEHVTMMTASAKEKGIDLTTETCPHYLIFNCEDFTHKVYPPIRELSQQESLWEGIKNGIIEMIASDHAPHTASEKSRPGWETPAGLSGVETLVPLLLNEVNNGKISISDFVRLTSEAPAKIWGIYPQKGNLLPGADADITIVDMNIKKTISIAELHSKSKTSPYDGMELQGCPVATITRGKFVMRDGKLTGSKGYGLLVSPKL